MKTPPFTPTPNSPNPHLVWGFSNIAVFVIFFGIALIEAVEKQNWLEAGLFLALGILSLRADFKGK